MRLYVKNRETNAKTYVRAAAKSRSELAAVIGGNSFVVDGHRYSVQEVDAETSSESAAVGAVIGGLIGAMGGGPGIIAGGLLGALFGRGQDDQEKIAVDNFNRSSLL